MIVTHGPTLPNHIVEWGVLIVTYPYFTGIVAGSTVITALVYLFGLRKLEQLERVGHFLAIALMLVAPLAPMFDLTQPIRAFKVPFYPNFSSPIILFFILWTILLLVMFLKSYFLFRRDFIQKAKEGGIWGSIAGFLTFGARDVRPEEDDKKVKFWAGVSIPVAMFFHAYVGFLMSAMHSMPLWGTSILLLVFLISAVVSGIGATLLLYIVGQAILGEKVNPQVLKVPTLVMASFAGFDLFVLFIKYVSEWYWNTAEWPLIAMAIKANMLFYLVEFVGLLFVLIGGLTSLNSTVGGISLLSIVSLISVYAARWTMVIPAQMIDKGHRGIVEPHIKLIGREGITEVIALYFLVFFLFFLFVSIAGWKSASHKEEVA
ncbi:MAG: NrfD/PsrC family molybdoenzyme membrane anchor subunit [Candidatus Caldarchaeum sp.]